MEYNFKPATKDFICFMEKLCEKYTLTSVESLLVITEALNAFLTIKLEDERKNLKE